MATANSRLAPQAIPAAWQAGQRTVELIDIGHESLNAPFYDQSILALRRSGRTTVTRLALTDLRDLVAAEGVSPPAGFIFHLGRCGSTLLANMLGSHPAVRTVKEPGVINTFLAETGLGHGSREANGDILHTLIAAFGRGLHGGHFVIKFTSWTVVDIERILKLFPATPAVFLWRPAAEIISSWMAKVPPWAWGENRSELARILHIEDLVPQAKEDDLVSYFSHVWLAEASAAYSMALRPHSMLTTVTYADLRDRPHEVMRDVHRCFKISVSSSEIRLMTEQAARYSKDKSGTASYDPQGVHRRHSMTGAERAIVDRITSQQELSLDRLACQREWHSP